MIRSVTGSKKEVITILLSLLLSISALVTPLATQITLPSTSSFSSSNIVCVPPRGIGPFSYYHTSLCHGSNTPLNHHREERRQSHEATDFFMDVDTAAISSPPLLNNAETLSSSSRKSFLQSLSIGIIATSQGQPAWGLPAVGPIVTNLQNGMLESRVLENVLSPPQYGMEANDISFPSYFTGVWNSKSTTKSIQAPCGIPLFGGNATYTRAMTEVGTSITYRSRFLPSSSNTNDQNAASSIAIADREFNVAEITKASMGTKAVMDIPIATPNKLSAVLSPNGADGMIVRADLLTLARREESVGKREFHCSEVVRQIVSPLGNAAAGGGRTRSSLMKEVETTSLYTASQGGGEEGDVREIRCLQRTATFLVPSQEDPMALRMWEASRGRPIDIRFYDVVYTKQ